MIDEEDGNPAIIIFFLNVGVLRDTLLDSRPASMSLLCEKIQELGWSARFIDGLPATKED